MLIVLREATVLRMAPLAVCCVLLVNTATWSKVTYVSTARLASIRIQMVQAHVPIVRLDGSVNQPLKFVHFAPMVIIPRRLSPLSVNLARRVDTWLSIERAVYLAGTWKLDFGAILVLLLVLSVLLTIIARKGNAFILSIPTKVAQ